MILSRTTVKPTASHENWG